MRDPEAVQLRPPFLRHQAEAQITICAKPCAHRRKPGAHPAYARRSPGSKKKIKITLTTQQDRIQEDTGLLLKIVKRRPERKRKENEQPVPPPQQ